MVSPIYFIGLLLKGKMGGRTIERHSDELLKIKTKTKQIVLKPRKFENNVLFQGRGGKTKVVLPSLMEPASLF